MTARSWAMIEPVSAYGAIESVQGDLKARIPLIGARIEKAAAPAIESAIRVERETGQAWLEG